MADISINDLFINADVVVKTVMLVLVIFSACSWTVILESSALLRKADKAFGVMIRQACAGDGELKVEDFPRELAEAVETAVKAGREWPDFESRAQYRRRVERAMGVSLGEWTTGLEKRLPLLATVGSTSPFIGLFGTVWGIMDSFIGIASTGETSLSVVAPGIAEALAATALGLVAAIPAVVAFNKISAHVKRLGGESASGVGLIADRLARNRFGRLDASES